MHNKQRSLQLVMLYFCISILLISMLLFTLVATNIIFSRITTNIEDLLSRSITIAWQEYDRFFDEENHSLAAMGSSEETRAMLSSREKTVQPFSSPLSEEDFLLAIDHHGKVIGSSLMRNTSPPSQLSRMVAPAWKDGKTHNSSELLRLGDYMKLFPEELIQKAQLPHNESSGTSIKDLPVMVQLAAVPVFDQDHTLLGCLVGGKIINNDETMDKSYSNLVPNSYFSIGVNGIRISTNIVKSHATVSFVGEKQPIRMYQTTNKGERYIGQTQPEPGVVHLVVSDPIRNGDSKIIGSLTIGILSQGVTNLKRDTMLTLLISMLICLGVAISIAIFLSKKISHPITELSQLAEEISQTESITEVHLNQLAVPAMSYFTEINRLHYCFRNMTTTLFKKSAEAKTYLEELNQGQEKLLALASELQQANNLLENRVRMRTEELQHAVEELKTANSLKTQFLANMSHELRTPLNSIIGFSEMLSDELYGELNETQKEYLEIVLNSANHLLELINDILDLSSIEREKVNLEKQPASLKELISSVVDIMSVQAIKKGLTLNYFVEAPQLYIDILRIKQVLCNVLSNSIKFTPSGGLIEVKAIQKGSQVVISVKDTGIGMSEEEQQNIFDEFYQGGDLYKRKHDGVGLGLPLTKKLVALHGGTIELTSKLGEGTTVTIYLPIDENSF